MKIEKLTVGRLQTNCYLVWSGTDREALIVDPGDDAEYILGRIRALNLAPRLIVATHGHFDHVLAVNELKWALKVSFALHPADWPLLVKMSRSARHWTGWPAGPVPKIDHELDIGEEIGFGKSQLEVLAAPGHTPGGIALYSPKEKILFSGDTLFFQGVGRTDFSYASVEDLERSLSNFFMLPEDTLVYPGHGPATTIGQERKFRE